MIRKIMAAAFALMLTVSMAWLRIIAWQEKVSSADNKDAAQLAGAKAATVLSAYEGTADNDTQPKKQTGEKVYTDHQIDEIKTMDIDALRKVNHDVKGWIRIPNTDVDYPLMWGDDNEYYLRYSWKNKPSAAGAIFIEHENTSDLSDFNTIIYGHNMRSGTMFGGLKEYSEQDYLEMHPYIYILHDKGVFRYDIFAAHRVRPETITYAMQIENPQLRDEFIRYALDNSQIHTGIIPTDRDRILTLSTCTDDSAFRWVVQGVLNEERSYYKDISLAE